MFENIKTYFIEVGLKKVLPSILQTATLMLVAYITAHKGSLSYWGIDYDPTDDTIDISLKTARAAALVGIPTLVTMFMAVLKHHAEAAVTGAPQSGDVRVNPTTPLVGGERKDDPPKGA